MWKSSKSFPVPNLACTLSLKSTPVEPPTEVIPVRFDPSPLNDVAVQVPVTVIPAVSVSSFLLPA